MNGRNIMKKSSLIGVLIALSMALACRAQEPRLVMGIIAPAEINLAQAMAVPIQLWDVWASGRNFPDAVTLKTDLGHFSGTDEQQLVVKKNGNTYPEVKLCFDNLAQAPLQPCHVSLIVDEKEIASHTITVRQAAMIRNTDYPLWSVPLGEKAQPWQIGWVVMDQSGHPLGGVPGLVQYTVPGVSPGAVAGISDGEGRFRVALPPAVYPGECAVRLITATCTSEFFRIPTQQPQGFDYPFLSATFAVPDEIVYPTRDDIPVLVAVSSRDGRPLPEQIMVGANKHYVVPLKDGVGRVLISLRDVPAWGGLRVIAFIEEKEGDYVYQRIFGETSIPVISSATVMRLHVEPLQQRTKDDPMCTLTVTMLDGDRPFPHLPVFVTYPRVGIAYQAVVQETDEHGVAVFTIPAGLTPDIHAFCGGRSAYVVVKQDDKGRVTAWGHTGNRIEETVTYDAEGRPAIRLAGE